MPTYAYRCSACDHRFDAVQRMVDDPLTECPSCGGFVRRLIQNVPVVFKGSGWYVTDSRKSQSQDAKTTDTKSEPAASENGAKPSETAKTAKTETAASSKPATASAAAD